MNNYLSRIIKSFLYHTAEVLYAIFPKKQILKFYCSVANTLRGITWRLACKFYGPNVVRYRGDIAGFIQREIKEGDSVLDVGCAEGNLTRIMAGRAKSVLAVDNEKTYVEPINKKAEEFKNVKFVIGNIMELKLENVFDVTFMIHAIEHFEKVSDLLEKLSRVSRKIVIETPDPGSDWLLKLSDDLNIPDLGDDKHIELFNGELLKKRLEDNGWEKVLIEKSYSVVRAVAYSKNITK